MTETIRNTLTRTLFTIASRDESTLVYPLPDEIFGFHAQQSCEKLLKALIAAHGLAPPLTHNLRELTRTLEVECSETLPSTPFMLVNLQPFAVQLRYDIGFELPEPDRAAIRHPVSILRAYILKRILSLQQL